METVYTILGLVEVCVLMASALALALWIMRAILRSIFVKPDETQKVPTEEELRHLKRAGSGMSG